MAPRFDIAAQVARLGAESLLPPEKPKPVQHEWKAQKADNAFLSKALPLDACYTAIDHARKMSAQLGKMRRDRGVKPGIPDWLIVWHGITLWIERKEGAAVSDNQETFRDQLIRNGHHWRLARSIEEIELACRDVGIPLRATFGDIHERVQDQQARLGVRKKRRRVGKPRAGAPSRAGMKFAMAHAALGRPK
jgi:hypothetical protein